MSTLVPNSFLTSINMRCQIYFTRRRCKIVILKTLTYSYYLFQLVCMIFYLTKRNSVVNSQYIS